MLEEAVVKEAMMIRKRGIDFRLIDRCRQKAVIEDMKEAKGESYEVAEVVAWVKSKCGALVRVNEQARMYTTSVAAIDTMVGELMFQYMKPEQQRLIVQLPHTVQKCKAAEAWLGYYAQSKVAARFIDVLPLQEFRRFIRFI